MPNLAPVNIAAMLDQAGRYRFDVTLDDQPIGSLPFWVIEGGPMPSDLGAVTLL